MLLDCSMGVGEILKLISVIKAPSKIKQSLDSTYSLTDWCPIAPSYSPRYNGWSSLITDLLKTVATTGMFVFATNLSSSSCNPKRCNSTPATMTGCFEEFIIAVASARASCIESMSLSYLTCCLTLLEYIAEVEEEGMDICSETLSLGISIYTGLLYRIADESTRSISWAAVSGSSIRTESTVTCSKILCCVSKSRTL